MAAARPAGPGNGRSCAGLPPVGPGVEYWEAARPPSFTGGIPPGWCGAQLGPLVRARLVEGDVEAADHQLVGRGEAGDAGAEHGGGGPTRAGGRSRHRAGRAHREPPSPRSPSRRPGTDGARTAPCA